MRWSCAFNPSMMFTGCPVSDRYTLSFLVYLRMIASRPLSSDPLSMNSLRGRTSVRAM